MDLLKELERRRDKVQDQITEKHAELEAIEKIIEGMLRDGIKAKKARATSRNGGGPDNRFAKVGLSDAIRAVAFDWASPSEIRDTMLGFGYRHKAKSSLLSGVFSTCKRLAEDEEFEVREAHGRKEYRLKPKVES